MADNPYESPRPEEQPKRDWRKNRWWRIAVGVALLCASIPAAFIAVAICCLVVSPGLHLGTDVPSMGEIFSLLVGALTFGLMIWAAVRWFRSA